MGVVLNLSGDGSVVIVPLISPDSSVSIFVAESREEVDEHVVGRHFAGNDFRVAGCVEDLLEFFGVHTVFTESVELLECSVNYLLSGGVGSASDSNEELVIVYKTILAGVKVFKKNTGFFLRNSAAEIFQAPVELLLVKKAVTIGVHHPKCFA